jgi:hypothetical protein
MFVVPIGPRVVRWYKAAIGDGWIVTQRAARSTSPLCVARRPYTLKINIATTPLRDPIVLITVLFFTTILKLSKTCTYLEAL